MGRCYYAGLAVTGISGLVRFAFASVLPASDSPHAIYTKPRLYGVVSVITDAKL